jgi:hypothetical protein
MITFISNSITLYILILSIIYNITHVYNIFIRIFNIKEGKYILNNKEKLFTLFTVSYILTYIFL